MQMQVFKKYIVIQYIKSFICDPTDCSPPDSSLHGDSPDKNTGMSCHALLQVIFPTQVSHIAGRFFLPSEPPGEKAIATHSSILAWKIPWTEVPGRLQSIGSQRVRHDWETSLSLSCTGEGNGNPLQCSCLENPRDGRAWWAAICGVAQSRTRLKQQQQQQQQQQNHQRSPWILESVTYPFSRGIFPTEESNQCLLHYRQTLYQLSYQGSLYKKAIVYLKEIEKLSKLIPFTKTETIIISLYPLQPLHKAFILVRFIKFLRNK